MTAEQRRAAVLEALKAGPQPVSAAALARRFGVSRQLIVGDVALLRACRHTAGEMEAELQMMVDNGCTVLDVIVEHPVYGQLTGALQLSSRYDVRQFILRANAAQPLSLLTEGVHLHTLSCPDEAAFGRVRGELAGAGFLLE